MPDKSSLLKCGYLIWKYAVRLVEITAFQLIWFIGCTLHYIIIFRRSFITLVAEWWVRIKREKTTSDAPSTKTAAICSPTHHSLLTVSWMLIPKKLHVDIHFFENVLLLEYTSPWFIKALLKYLDRGLFNYDRLATVNSSCDIGGEVLDEVTLDVDCTVSLREVCDGVMNCNTSCADETPGLCFSVDCAEGK